MENIDLLEQKMRKLLEEYNLLKKNNLETLEQVKELMAYKPEMEKIREKREKAKTQVDDIIDTIDKIQLDLKL